MNYNLNQASDKTEQKISNLASLRKLITLIGEERRNLIIAFAAIFLNAGLSLLGPYLIGYTIDTYILTKQYHGLLVFAGILFGLYIVAFIVNYIQMRMMGGIGHLCRYSSVGVRASRPADRRAPGGKRTASPPFVAAGKSGPEPAISSTGPTLCFMKGFGLENPRAGGDR